MSKNLYENADIYDLVYNNQSNQRLMDYYAMVFKDKQITTIHDCSFGTGHLSFALADMGYQVSGSDISNDMLNNAKKNAQNRYLDIHLVQSDFCKIADVMDTQFDCVMSTGNSLAHVNNQDLKTALTSMAKLIKPGGYLYLDTRNWDKILESKQRFFCYNPFFKDGDRINLVQVWDHLSDKEIVFNLLYTFEKDNKIYKQEETAVKYYPFTKDLLMSYLNELGFEQVEIFDFMKPDNTNFEDMNWYSLCAKKNTL